MKGAKEFPEIKALEKKAFRAVSDRIREDGAFVEAGENDNLIVQKLEANPEAVGIFGFSFLDQNADKMQGAVVDGRSRPLRTSPLALIRLPARCSST